ncbi:cold shock domain-containing protein [Limibaculum sp. FT325]|uniref:cold-shock protein n=1 Tax=Thermohalobaculum sediminis TaxID=2939436 RepID=UPI0020C13A44|nr:cold shock domain-containing protein [Limibaculum sediminis]MCL5777864.1 cold shock domain-containing protein [Limibaculum sediminis]
MSEDMKASGSVVAGRVKWYDAVKGYGFVVPEAGGSDIMVHASCVRNFGRTALPEGARIEVLTAEGARGLHAREILSVADPEPSAESGDQGLSDAPRPTDFLGPEAEAGPLQPARVKWFDKQKGFGFVNVFGLSEDVFVHMEIVRRSGFADLSSGEGMAVRTFRGPRGLMVAEVRLWDAGALPDGTRASATE